MYQTVGQDAIQFVADALEVPLCRKVITGAAVEQGNEYGDRSKAAGTGVPGDETEDLYSLLSNVKVHARLTRHFYPVNFVLSGIISRGRGSLGRGNIV